MSTLVPQKIRILSGVLPNLSILKVDFLGPSCSDRQKKCTELLYLDLRFSEIYSTPNSHEEPVSQSSAS